jgi:hypothetical protein
LAEENYDWIFVNRIPMLCDKTRIAKQQKIETWLKLYELAEKLGLMKSGNREPMKYVI